MAKYTLSRKIDTPDGEEVFTAHEFASFDEARVALDKGVRDRKLQIKESKKQPAETVTESADVTPSNLNSTAAPSHATTTGD